MSQPSTPRLDPAHAPDLTRRPPRSPHARLGGYVLLPRILDKCRADLAGTNGEYHYNGPLDHLFFRFTGVSQEALRAEVARGKGDGELLEWVQAHSTTPRQPWEILQWSDYQARRGPDGDPERVALFARHLAKFTQTRQDVHTWPSLTDLDDHVSFGSLA